MTHLHRNLFQLAGLVSVIAALAAPASALTMATFEDVGLGVEDEYHGEDGAGSFTSGGATFLNDYNATWDSWAGFSASTGTDVMDASYANQWAAAPGGGAGGSAAYGVGYVPSQVVFTQETSVISADFTNTVLTATSMAIGDAFAKQFGGATGDDADWYLLTVFGFDAGGASTGSVPFYLADYRFADNSQDYIVSDWTTVDLTSLGDVKTLRFGLTSSDVGPFGINTPSYFAIDNLAFIPEPGTAMLVGLGMFGLGMRRRMQ